MKAFETSGMNKPLKWTLTIVRLAIGWHFLYEGVAKIISATWSSAPYLAGSKWLLAPLLMLWQEAIQ